MTWNLEGYQPQEIQDDDFKPFGGKYTVNVREAKIDSVPAGTRDGESYEGYDRLKWKLEVFQSVKPEHSVNIGRILFKSFNISSENGAKILADLLNSVGLQFKNRDELNAQIPLMVNKSFSVSCWVGKDGKQASKFIKNDEVEASSGVKAPF